MAESSPKGYKTLWEKEKLNSRYIKTAGFFGKWLNVIEYWRSLTLHQTILCFNHTDDKYFLKH